MNHEQAERLLEIEKKVGLILLLFVSCIVGVGVYAAIRIFAVMLGGAQ